jgi:uroporphyrinogen-III decarboxylase
MPKHGGEERRQRTMTDAQWERLLATIAGERTTPRPTGFIIDSPWLPGWNGGSTLDFYTSDAAWFAAHPRAHETFPEAMFLPGFWSEYGMCTEPSAFGARCLWEEKNLPHAEKIVADVEADFTVPRPDPRKDGLLPFVLNRLKLNRDAVRRTGHDYRFAVARGPLNIATFLCGTTEFLMGLKINEGPCVRLLDLVTDFLIDWLAVQLEAFDTIDGIFILDDLIGFLGPEDFETYARPSLKRLFGAFDVKVKFLHNDAHGLVCAPHLAGLGINLFNFSHEHGLAPMRQLCGPSVVLLGNVPPRDVLAGGTPEQIAASVRAAAAELPDDPRVILSAGGGIPPGVTTAQLRAFLSAVGDLPSGAR